MAKTNTSHSSDIVLQLKDVACQLGENKVVNQINFTLKAGESACLLGPSGCGKTTLLRSIAGLESITSGSIEIHGKICSKPHFLIPPEKRDLGLVFQDHALFPHLSIYDNVAFGLRKLSKDQKQHRVNECLELVGLQDYGQRFPHQVSGGQQQRVALARTIAPKPSLILFDEPFSSLDTHLRRSLAKELKELLRELNIASLLVTHDQQEAFTMADYIGVMHQGNLLQWDTPYQLYHEPVDAQIASFIGQGHFITGSINKDPTSINKQQVSTILGDFLVANNRDFTQNQPVLVLMRPDDIHPNPSSPLKARVVHKIFKGAIIEYELELPNKERLIALFPSHHDYPLAQDIGFDLDVKHLIVYPSQIELTK